MYDIGLIRQLWVTITAAFCMTIAASVFTWLTPIAIQFTSKDSPIPMTELERSWVTGCASIGNLLASIPVGLLGHRYGRKTVLLLAGPIALFGWLLMIFTRSLTILYIAGLIHGYVIATTFTICPIYIGEISSANIRGTLSGQFMTLYYIGSVYVSIFAYFTNYTIYIYILALLPAVFSIIFYKMPETPYYLLMVGKEDEAISILTWLMPSINNEEILRKTVEIKSTFKKEFSWKNFIFISNHRRSLFIVISAYCLKCLSGIISLIVYATQLFKSITNNDNSAVILTVVLNVVLAITCSLSGFVSDKFGRRPVMYITTFASGIFHLIVALYLFIYDSKLDLFTNTNLWIIFICITLSLVLNNASISVFLPTICAEYFTTEARSLGASITHAAGGGLIAFLSIIIYQIVKDNVGDYFNFIIFSVNSFGAAAIIFYFFQETARKNLEDIQKEVGTSS